jgi:hypothetical protein
VQGPIGPQGATGPAPVSPFTINAHSATETPFTIVANSPQTATLLDVLDSTRNRLLGVDSTGRLLFNVQPGGPAAGSTFGTEGAAYTLTFRGGWYAALQVIDGYGHTGSFGASGITASSANGDYSINCRILALGQSPAVPANVGAGVVYLKDAVTLPSANPTGGGVLYGTGGGILRWRNTAGIDVPVAQLAPNFVFGIIPPQSQSGAAVFVGANDAYLYAVFPQVMAPITVSKIHLGINVQSGNVDVGIYSLSGTTLTRVASAGGIACPAVNADGDIALSASVTLQPGTLYYLAIACDNVTASFYANLGPPNLQNAPIAGQMIYRFLGAYPLPASLTTTSAVGTIRAYCLSAK